MAAKGFALPEKTGFGSRDTDKVLLHDLYELAWLQYLADPLPEEQVIRYLPVLIYSNIPAPGSLETLELLSKAIVKIFQEHGFDLVADLPARTGSTWKEFVFKTRQKLTANQFKDKVKQLGSATHALIKKADEVAKDINDAIENLCKLGKNAIVILGFGASLFVAGPRIVEGFNPSTTPQNPPVCEQTTRPEDLHKNRDNAAGLEKLAMPSPQNRDDLDQPTQKQPSKK